MTVYLVVPGPAIPVVALRGAEVLRLADVVVHDRLSAVELLELAPDTAERIDVGKAPRHHRMTQDDINTLLVERDLTGQTVVRLKGGDPFVFTRGSEEAHALGRPARRAVRGGAGRRLGAGGAGLGGIPVTQRFSSTSFTVVAQRGVRPAATAPSTVRRCDTGWGALT